MTMDPNRDLQPRAAIALSNGGAWLFAIGMFAIVAIPMLILYDIHYLTIWRTVLTTRSSIEANGPLVDNPVPAVAGIAFLAVVMLIVNVGSYIMKRPYRRDPMLAQRMMPEVSDPHLATLIARARIDRLFHRWDWPIHAMLFGTTAVVVFTHHFAPPWFVS